MLRSAYGYQPPMPRFQRPTSEPAAGCHTLDPHSAKPYHPSQTSGRDYRRVMCSQYKGTILMPSEGTRFYPPPKQPSSSELSNLGRYLLGQYTYPTIPISSSPSFSPVDATSHPLEEDMEMSIVEMLPEEYESGPSTFTDTVETELTPVSPEGPTCSPTAPIAAASTVMDAGSRGVQLVKELSSNERRHSLRLKKKIPLDYKILNSFGKAVDWCPSGRSSSKRAMSPALTPYSETGPPTKRQGVYPTRPPSSPVEDLTLKERLDSMVLSAAEPEQSFDPTDQIAFTDKQNKWVSSNVEIYHSAKVPVNWDVMAENFESFFGQPCTGPGILWAYREFLAGGAGHLDV